MADLNEPTMGEVMLAGYLMGTVTSVCSTDLHFMGIERSAKGGPRPSFKVKMLPPFLEARVAHAYGVDTEKLYEITVREVVD